MNRQLKTRQVCLFAVAFLPVTKFFLLPSVLASECGQDMWIACLLDVLADAAAVISVLILNSLTDKTFFELLEITFGKTIKNLLRHLWLIQSKECLKRFFLVILFCLTDNLLQFKNFCLLLF